MTAPKYKELRRAYGFDEVAIVPGDITTNPEQTSIEFKVAQYEFSVPIMAAAMDAVVDIKFATLMSQVGGLAVLNLEGIQTRYENPQEQLGEIVRASSATVTGLLQKIYSTPIQENLIGDRIRAIKESGAVCAVSTAPMNTKRFAPMAAEAGADIFVVQSQVTSARHVSKSYHGLVFSELKQAVKMPILVGNCVSYSACMELLRTGIDGVFVGVGPGAACTTREVLGIGVPQITATMDCAAARDAFFEETGKYVPIITDGGFHRGGDICKAFVAGADCVMLGSILAQAKEAPGLGYNWGMASPHPALPRGTRIKVGTTAPLQQLLFGPTTVTNGTQNLTGVLRTCMGACGVLSIKEMHRAELVVAPAITTEGKSWQMAASS
jgi:IMP dehydrogenase